jgi:hypothetical protein
MSRSHLLEVLRQKAIFIVFSGWRYNPSPTLALGSENSPLMRPMKGFPQQPSVILASRKTFQKLSSNGIDPSVDHRQNRIYPVPGSIAGA